MEMDSNIVKWYQGKAIFITGATGFMGKVLVEKLLRSCRDIGPIYVLIREKKNMRPQDRVDKIMSSRAFDEIRAMQKDRKDWLIPIFGDVGLPNLGISTEDRHQLQETVSVVFHLAATVRFDEPLRVAVAINYEGTRELMEFCLGMKKLSALVHVSTAYANCDRSIIEERIYPPPAEPDRILHCLAGLNDSLLELVAPSLVGSHPNTYTFTKALAEHMVAGYSTELPIVIVRPSIVMASWKEPFPGWVDNYNGPTGLLVGARKRLLRSLYGKSQCVADLIPVDVCVNLFIAAAWEIGTRDRMNLNTDVRVYNCVSGPFKPVTWKEFIVLINNSFTKYIAGDRYTCPTLRMTDNRVTHTLLNLITLTLLSMLADAYIWCTGGKPRYWFYRHKLTKIGELTEFFTSHEFQFNADNMEDLKRRLDPADRVLFNFDLTEIKWKEYVTTYFLGIRDYLLREKNVTTPVSRKKTSG